MRLIMEVRLNVLASTSLLLVSSSMEVHSEAMHFEDLVVYQHVIALVGRQQANRQLWLLPSASLARHHKQHFQPCIPTFQHSNLAHSPHAHAAVSGGRRNSRDIVQESTVQLVPLSVSFHSTVRYSYPSIINGDTLSTRLVFSGDRLRHNLANRKGQAVIGRELTHSRLA
jgi:hypothetical protein